MCRNGKLVTLGKAGYNVNPEECAPLSLNLAPVASPEAFAEEISGKRCMGYDPIPEQVYSG